MGAFILVETNLTQIGYASRVAEAVRPRVVQVRDRVDALASEASSQLASRSQVVRDSMRDFDQYLSYDLDDFGALGVTSLANLGHHQTHHRA
ncbi:MAG: hypothetical protein C0507_20120 [Cyanobacteria bacterium PR.3.49]|nr:hypothetical protein [Cyanobacteria bacterium PR.3.49]